MDTILVPIDFAISAEHVLHSAARVASAIKGTVLLVNVYQLPVSMNDTPVLTISPEDIRQNVENELTRMKEWFAANYPDVAVQTESRLGDISYELEEVSKKVRPFA